MRSCYCLLLLSSVSMAAKKTAAPAAPTILDMVVDAAVCTIGCGPIAILFIILPAIAVFIWKKLFSIG